ncbi:metallophosphoesterase family protein [Deinococcus cellulosilyticus]|uniref:Metallophosphoesterase n=1 Tax=Deinococcus cellulosilyticus (strain DSM 18568 / NBRC 106333 / KACC 11606 / 5516J-15) TaxID=1223518 RepID=A0A511NBF6_DEIC1|nr:metallophosphoesterase family protein [Deinococcus cellulosilyticus]GEM49927.1 metallophosphoesterase [Deinococcus cellulosilyticus NBRC 106333 = KACC 11606]
MRTLIFSDIHANLEAFEAVLKDAEKRQYDRMVFLGDAIGYGGSPVEVLQHLRQLGVPCIQGNHESNLIRLTRNQQLLINAPAQLALKWQLDQLSEADLLMINTWGKTLRLDTQNSRFTDLLCVHGSPSNPDKYLDSTSHAREEFTLWDGRVCFYGHTHVPMIYSTLEGPVGEWVKSAPMKGNARAVMPPKARWMLNPGSVGQPRDGDPRASYGVFDDANAVFEVFRVEYDFQAAGRKIINAGLPSGLADRLIIGR